MDPFLSFHEQGILVMLDMHRMRDDEEFLNNDADELIGSLVSTPVAHLKQFISASHADLV